MVLKLLGVLLALCLGVIEANSAGSKCAKELQSILYRPEVCNVRFFKKAECAITAFTPVARSSAAEWTQENCNILALSLGLNLQVNDQDQNILCFGLGNIQNIYTADLASIFAELLRRDQIQRILIYAAISQVYGAAISAVEISTFGVNIDTYGIYTIGYYFYYQLAPPQSLSWNAAMAVLQTLIAAFPPTGQYSQTDLQNFQLMMQMVAQNLANDQEFLVLNIYNPMLGVVQPGSSVGAIDIPAVTAIWILSLAALYAYTNPGNIYNPNIDPPTTTPSQRAAWYSQEFMLFAWTIGIAGSYAILEPFAVTNLGLCNYGFTLPNDFGQVVKVILSNPIANVFRVC
jgi:hypothetical protein